MKEREYEGESERERGRDRNREREKDGESERERKIAGERESDRERGASHSHSRVAGVTIVRLIQTFACDSIKHSRGFAWQARIGIVRMRDSERGIMIGTVMSIV